MEFFKKDTLSIISNIPLLSRMLITYFFFELYFSLNQTSLWQLDLEFSKVSFSPFLYFLFFITFMFLPWYLINFIKDIVRVQLNGKATNLVKWQNSYKSFLLICLSLYFIIDPSYPPGDNKFIHGFYIVVLCIILISSCTYFITSEIKHYSDKSNEIVKVKIIKEQINPLKGSIDS
jgi:hypothetical protein